MQAYNEMVIDDYVHEPSISSQRPAQRFVSKGEKALMRKYMKLENSILELQSRVGETAHKLMVEGLDKAARDKHPKMIYLREKTAKLYKDLEKLQSKSMY